MPADAAHSTPADAARHLSRRSFNRLLAAAALLAGVSARPGAAWAKSIFEIVGGRIGRDAAGTNDYGSRVPSGAIEAHLAHLARHHKEIVGYTWQESTSGTTGYEGDSMRMVHNSHNVALVDLTGDGVPDLLWLAGDNSKPSEEPSYRGDVGDEATYMSRAKLHAATWTGGEERVLFDGDGFPWAPEDAAWANEATGAIGLDDVRFGDGSISDPLYMPEMCWDSRLRNFGGRYFKLFVSGDDDSLYAEVDLSEETVAKTSLARLGIDRQYNTLAWVDPPFVRVEDVPQQTVEYFHGETPISQDEYEQRRAWIYGQASAMLMMNGPMWLPEGWGDPPVGPDEWRFAEQSATSFGKALHALAGELGKSVVVYRDEKTEIHPEWIGSDQFDERFKQTVEYTHDEYIDETLSQLIARTPSTEYSSRLAHVLVALATAAYDPDCARDSLLSLGCLEDVFGYNYYDDPFDPAYGKDSVAFCIGMGTLDDGRPLVVLSIRGSYGEIDAMEFFRLMAYELTGAEDVFSSSTLTPDWASDLNLGIARTDVGQHEGFSIAAQEVYEKLEQRVCWEQGIEGLHQSQAVFVVCGHSRGAGVGNLVATRLINAGVPKERLYCYNFACPDTARQVGGKWNPDGRFDSIFNIGYAADLVSRVPGFMADIYGTGASGVTGEFGALGTEWGKYGKSYWYADDWGKFVEVMPSMLSHIPQNYVSHLRAEPGLDQFRDYSRMEMTFATGALIKLLGFV